MHVTADGAFLYARGDDALAAYAWEPAGPRVVGLQVLRDGEAGTSGLRLGLELLFSPDDAHAYVTSHLGDTVAVFSRDPGTGLLSFVEVQTNGVGGVAQMAAPTYLAMSADGDHLYVTSWVDRTIVVFQRNPSTGALTFVEAEPLPPNGSASDVVASPEGNHVYVVSESAGRIYVFDRNATTGELALASEIESAGRTGIVLSPDGEHAYAWGNSWIGHFLRDTLTGALTFRSNEAFSSGQDDVVMSPDGETVVSARFGGVSTFLRDNATGDLTFVTSQSPGIQGTLALAPDKAWIFQASAGLGVYALSPALDLTYAGRHRVPGGGSGIFAGTIGPDGEQLYAAIGAGVVVYDRDPLDGSAELEEILFDGFDGQGIDQGRDLAVSPDGAHVYLTRRNVLGPFGHRAAVAAFSRDALSGRLTHVETESVGPGGGGPFDAPRIRISPDGAHVYAVSYQGSNLCRFDRDPGTGALTFVEEIATFNAQPAYVIISPDGAFVYAPGNIGGVPYDDLSTVLHVYARDGGTGTLQMVDSIDVPNETTGAALSPDGAQLYVSSSLDGDGSHKPLYRLLTYDRDPGSGSLTLSHEELSRKNGVLLDEPTGVAVSFDGSHVYVESDTTAPGLASFVRNQTTGKTAFVELVEGIDLPLISNSFDEHIYLSSEDAPRPDSFDTFAPGFQCSPAPAVGCRTPTKATLQIIDDVVKDKSDRIKFTWRGDTPTTHPEFDPAGKPYGVCVYDSRGIPEALLASALIPADQVCGNSGKPCWTDKTKKINYKDPNKTPEGVSQLTLQPSDTKPQIKAKLQGVDLGWRVATPLPPVPPVLVQVQGESGPCWEASFSAAIKNDGRQFRSVALP